MTLNQERGFPLGISVGVVVILLVVDFFTAWDFSFPEKAHFLLSVSITISAIVPGFMATSMSLLMGLDSPLAKRLKDTEYNNEFLSYFRSAILLALAFGLLSIAGYWIIESDKMKMGQWYPYTWLFLGLWALLAFWRCQYLLFKLLRTNPTI